MIHPPPRFGLIEANILIADLPDFTAMHQNNVTRSGSRGAYLQDFVVSGDAYVAHRAAVVSLVPLVSQIKHQNQFADPTQMRVSFRSVGIHWIGAEISGVVDASDSTDVAKRNMLVIASRVIERYRLALKRFHLNRIHRLRQKLPCSVLTSPSVVLSFARHGGHSNHNPCGTHRRPQAGFRGRRSPFNDASKPLPCDGV